MSAIWTMGEILVEIMRPRKGMPLDETGEFLGPFPSGAPAIFADTVARLDRVSGIIGGVGDDDFGRCVLGRLKRDGVRCEHVRVAPGRATAVTFITQSTDGSRRFLFHLDGTAAVLAEGEIPVELPAARFFHLMGCSLAINKAFAGEIVRVAGELRRQGAKISLDPNLRLELLGREEAIRAIEPIMAQCSVFLPGLKELLMLMDETSQESAVGKLFSRYPLEIIVVKKGKEGCSVHTRETAFDTEAFPVKEIDPTGAGDCFDAGFLCGLLEGKQLALCARLGAAAGALNAQAFGPMEGAISRDRVQAMIDGG